MAIEPLDIIFVVTMSSFRSRFAFDVLVDDCIIFNLVECKPHATIRPTVQMY
jgi:hypothetical protein